MRIQFVRDYRGAATNETFYPAGAIADLPLGASIVAEGAATPAPSDEHALDQADDGDVAAPSSDVPVARRKGRAVT